MKIKRFNPAIGTLLLMFVLTLGGCSGQDDMEQKEIEYLSHMDQAQFFQRQGELKASTQEARSAMATLPEQIDPYFILSDNLLTAGDGDNAERQLVQLRERIDEPEEHRENLNRIALMTARAKLLQNRPEQALSALEEIQEPDRSQQIEKQVVTGDSHRQAGRHDEARQAYEAALEQDSEAIMALIGMSRSAYAEDNLDRTREWISRAEDTDPEDSELWLWKGQVAHQQENLEEAREAYTRALEDIGRYDVMTFQKYSTISALIDVLHRLGEASQAFVYEEILAESAPGTIQSGMESAREQYSEGNLDRAASHLEEVLEQAPGHEDAQILLGIIRFQQGRVEEAESLLAEHAEKAESGELTKLLAAARIQMERPEEAREMLEKLDPEGSDPGVAALIGIAALSSGDHELGRALIEQSLQSQPDNTTLRTRYARYLVSQGESSDAIKQLEEAIKRTPDIAAPRILLAQIHSQAQDHDKAEAVAAKWREDKPDSVQAVNASGDLAQTRGDMDAARRYYQDALELNPQARESHYALGALEARAGNRDKAAGHFRDAVRSEPDHRESLQALIGVSNQNEDSLAETMSFLQDLADERSEAIGPRLALLEFALQQGEHERASNLADGIARRLDSRTRASEVVGGVFHTVAERRLAAGETDQARRIIRAGRDRFRDHERLALADARLQFQRGRNSDAREILRNVKTTHPGSPLPYITEADYLASQGELRRAVELYNLARDKEDSASTLLKQANALRQDGRTIRALELLEKGADRFPGDAQVHLNLAMAYQTEDQRDNAIGAYRRTLALEPNQAVALNNLAWLYHEDENEDALELAERAYQLNPRSAAIIDTYGWILLHHGEVERSVELLEEAHELSPDSLEIAEHLAEAYRASGNDDKADALLERI